MIGFTAHVLLKGIGTLVCGMAVHSSLRGEMAPVDVVLVGVVGLFIISLGTMQKKTKLSIPAYETEDGILLEGIHKESIIA